MKELLKGLGLGLGVMVGLSLYHVVCGACAVCAYEDGMKNGKEANQQES